MAMSVGVGTTSIVQRGVVVIARALGRAAGAIARLLGADRRPPGRGRRRSSEHSRLLAEIAGLERELDQAYYQMALGDTGLGGLLARVRELKERLRKARVRLRRLVRRSAMDLRLRRSPDAVLGRTGGETPGSGQIVMRTERRDFEDEEVEFEFESLLDGDY
jgi:hypothetical protein